MFGEFVASLLESVPFSAHVAWYSETGYAVLFVVAALATLGL